MTKIVKLNSILDPVLKEKILEQVKFIFYSSSSILEFSSPERKIAFFQRWCGEYISHYSDEFYIMYEDQKVLGYLSGCLDSKNGNFSYPGYRVFEDLFEQYPAHLHINFHLDARGRGLGSLLVEAFCADLKNAGIRGVHLVTSTDAKNISFYKRLDFNYQVSRILNQMNLLFMGKILD